MPIAASVLWHGLLADRGSPASGVRVAATRAGGRRMVPGFNAPCHAAATAPPGFELGLGLQPKLKVPARRLARRLPQGEGPLRDFNAVVYALG